MPKSLFDKYDKHNYFISYGLGNGNKLYFLRKHKLGSVNVFAKINEGKEIIDFFPFYSLNYLLELENVFTDEKTHILDDIPAINFGEKISLTLPHIFKGQSAFIKNYKSPLEDGIKIFIKKIIDTKKQYINYLSKKPDSFYSNMTNALFKEANKFDESSISVIESVDKAKESFEEIIFNEESYEQIQKDAFLVREHVLIWDIFSLISQKYHNILYEDISVHPSAEVVADKYEQVIDAIKVTNRSIHTFYDSISDYLKLLDVFIDKPVNVLDYREDILDECSSFRKKIKPIPEENKEIYFQVKLFE